MTLSWSKGALSLYPPRRLQCPVTLLGCLWGAACLPHHFPQGPFHPQLFVPRLQLLPPHPAKLPFSLYNTYSLSLWYYLVFLPVLVSEGYNLKGLLWQCSSLPQSVASTEQTSLSCVHEFRPSCGFVAAELRSPFSLLSTRGYLCPCPSTSIGFRPFPST